MGPQEPTAQGSSENWIEETSAKIKTKIITMDYDSILYVSGAVFMASLTFFSTLFPELPIIVPMVFGLRAAYMAWNISRA